MRKQVLFLLVIFTTIQLPSTEIVAHIPLEKSSFIEFLKKVEKII